MAQTQQDIRQSVLRTALNMAGTGVNATVDTILPVWDAQIGKLYEDRNIMLTDGGTITFTGTQVQFTDNLKLTINQNIAGAVPYVLNLGSTSQNFPNSGDMLVCTITSRTAQTFTLSIVSAGSALPAVANANQEVFLIAKRLDAADGTQRLYFRNGSAFNAGQTARLGSAGSGGTGSGIGDDLDSLQFAASFTDLFGENSSNSNSSVNATGTNATFNAAKSMYVVSYDASKTVTTTGTAVTMSGAPAFTVAVGDILISGGVAKKITAVTSQTSYTIESAFASNLAAAACCVSQAVYTKDINNLAVDGSALSASFPASFSEIMVDYKDSSTSGSNIFTPGTPVIAWSGSPDNTNFTSVNTRSASELISQTSTFLPSAGTSLYLRFFANKSSGSGTVNLISYKAFLQKSVTAAGTSNVLWSTFAMTNSSTTPINCSVSVIGGKTTITVTNNSYPVGLLTGQTIGALEVLLNGVSIDRFVAGSTPTTDAYYTELSANAIQLDRDYSSQALSISLIYSLQVIDSSTTNTTQISALQGVMGDGFQGYVTQNTLMNATSSTGTPVAGTFYSSIVGRAAMPDLSQDLKPRFGIERVEIQSLQQVQNEFGPNGEQIWSNPNDLFGQFRAAGSWVAAPGPAGSGVSATNAGDFFEITFYGTGLNILAFHDANARNWTVSIDGGSFGSNQYVAGVAGLWQRNYSPNTVFNVASGLPLGIHTAKILINASTFTNQGFYGYEIINQFATGSNLVTVNPGVAYNSGNKAALTAQSTAAYNAAVVGTTGGRVVEYITAAGTRGQAFTQNASSPSYLTSASHTNEEVVRIYWPREFGAGRSDDFSLLTISPRLATFTLDDGITSLIGNNSNFTIVNSQEGLWFGAVSNFLVFTFVGTGLDVQVSSTSFVGTMNYQVDGNTATSLAAPTSGVTNVKIASGLPYGAHTVRFILSAYTGGTQSFSKFIVYQPKTPAIPSGAVQVGSYNVMANYAVNNTAGSASSDGGYISTGILIKSCIREFVYSGSWSAVTDSGSLNGQNVFTSTTGDYVQYTFFGTGFDFKFTSGVASSTWQVTVDGSTNLSGFTTTSIGNVTSFTASTGTFITTAGVIYGCGVTVSGLTLGLHTIKVAKTAGTGLLYFNHVDIITPIHSPKSNLYADLQNTLTVGSNAISDDRKTSPIKDGILQRKNLSQAFGLSTSATTSSTTAVPMPDMSVTHANTSGRIQISYFATILTPNGQATNFQIYVDGVAVGNIKSPYTQSALSTAEASDLIVLNVSPGIHKIDVYWWDPSGNTSTINSANRNLTVLEVN